MHVFDYNIISSAIYPNDPSAEVEADVIFLILIFQTTKLIISMGFASLNIYVEIHKIHIKSITIPIRKKIIYF